MRSVHKFLWLCLLALTTTLVPRPALAKTAERRVLVTEFSGEDADGVRSGVLSALARRKKIRLVSLRHAVDVAGDLDADLGKRAGVSRVARALGLSALVEGEVKQRRGSVEATLRVLSPKGQVVETRKLRAASPEELHDKLEKTTWRLLGSSIRELAPKTDGGPQRIVLTHFDGAGNAAVRGWVAGALKRRGELALVPDREVPKDLARGADDENESDIIRIAQSVNAAAVIVGEVTRRGRTHLARIKLMSGSDGGVLGEYEFDAPYLGGMKAKIDRDLAPRMQPALSLAKAPVPPRETIPSRDAEADRGQGAPKLSKTSTDRGREPLRATLGAGVFARHFRYTGVSDPTLRPYDLGAAPLQTVSLRWFPGAHFTDGAGGNLGLDGRFDRAVLLETRAPDGTQASTRATHWLAQGVFRVPVSAHELDFLLGYGQDEFAVDASSTRPLLPDVKYGFVRLGAEGRLVFGDFSLGSMLGGRLLTGVGEVGEAEWFPESSGFGLDAGLFAEWQIIPMLRAVVAGDYRRYGLSLGSSGPARASAAVDEYPAGWAGLRFTP
ncbi:MAG: hypothetical protein IPI67_24850 [Myxococcales bacterium]|nr:hypothetical protein [Myxococcales bacterium]